jgi:hypothetical protein
MPFSYRTHFSDAIWVVVWCLKAARVRIKRLILWAAACLGDAAIASPVPFADICSFTLHLIRALMKLCYIHGGPCARNSLSDLLYFF